MDDIHQKSQTLSTWKLANTSCHFTYVQTSNKIKPTLKRKQKEE